MLGNSHRFRLRFRQCRLRPSIALVPRSRWPRRPRNTSTTHLRCVARERALPSPAARCRPARCHCCEEHLLIPAALDDLPTAVTVTEDPDRAKSFAGIRVRFGAVSTDYTAVVTCDMPFVDPALVETDLSGPTETTPPSRRSAQTGTTVYRLHVRGRAPEATQVPLSRRSAAPVGTRLREPRLQQRLDGVTR